VQHSISEGNIMRIFILAYFTSIEVPRNSVAFCVLKLIFKRF
jgi:hypothetical protein